MFITLKKIILFIFGFYLLFLPDISFISSFFGDTVIAFILFCINVILLNKNIIYYFKKFKLFPIILVNIILVFYVLILNLYGNFSISNFISNITFIFNIINYLSLIIWIRKIYGNNTSFIDYFVKIGLIQSLFIIIMIIFPPLKEIANFLYSQGATLEARYEYASTFRVFGIGSGYTFMLPLTMGLIAVLAMYKFFQTNTLKYFIWSLFIVVSSAMNGRTGLYIYLLILLLFAMKWLVQKITIKKFIMIFLLGSTFFSATTFVYYAFPIQSSWIFEGVFEILNYISGDGAQGNVGALVGDHLVFPNGIDLIFGTGQLVFGELGINYIGVGSDIGYINDLFKGGIVYVLLLYTIHFSYFFKNIDDKLLAVSLILYLVIANYKGRVMINSPVLLLTYSIAINNLYLKFAKNNGNKVKVK